MDFGMSSKLWKAVEIDILVVHVEQLVLCGCTVYEYVCIRGAPIMLWPIIGQLIIGTK